MSFPIKLGTNGATLFDIALQAPDAGTDFPWPAFPQLPTFRSSAPNTSGFTPSNTRGEDTLVG